jgi:hypothetical protein
LQQDHRTATNSLLTVAASPDKARRQADLAISDLSTAQTALAAADVRLREAEATVKSSVEKVRQKQLEHAQLMAATERARIMASAKERSLDDLAKDLDLAGVEADKILADQVDLDSALRVRRL